MSSSSGDRASVGAARWSRSWRSRTSADPVTDSDLHATAAERIARYKLPKAYVRVKTVLRSPSGKADYRWAQQVARNPEETR